MFDFGYFVFSPFFCLKNKINDKFMDNVVLMQFLVKKRTCLSNSYEASFFCESLYFLFV